MYKILIHITYISESLNMDINYNNVLYVLNKLFINLYSNSMYICR